MVSCLLVAPRLQAMCAFALKDAAAATQLDPDSDLAWQQILQSHSRDIFDEKFASRSFQAFTKRLINRIAKSTSKDSVRSQVIEAAMKKARRLIAQKIKDAQTELESFEGFQYAKQKIEARNKLMTRIANEVLEEINIDRILWLKMAPYLEQAQVNLKASTRHFDRFILMMSNIIESELDQAGIEGDEREALIEIYLKRSAAALPARIAEDVLKNGYFEPGGETKEQRAGYRKQQANVTRKVKKDIRIHELSWMRMAPLTAAYVRAEAHDQAEPSKEQRKIIARVTPEIVRRVSRSAGEFTVERNLTDGMKVLDPAILEALPLIVQADLGIYGPINSKEAKEEQDERITQTVIASIKLFLTEEAPKITSLATEIDPEELMIYVRYFPFYLIALKQRRVQETGQSNGWEEAIEPTLDLYLGRVLTLRAESDFRDIQIAAPKDNQQKGSDYGFLTEDVYYYRSPDEIDPQWKALYNEMQSSKERRIFLRYYSVFKSWVDARVLWFSQSADDEVPLTRGLLPGAFAVLKTAIQNEAKNFEPDHASVEGRTKHLRLQAQRLRDAFRTSLPLTDAELALMPEEFLEYRANIEGRKALRAFDLAWPLFVSHSIGRMKLKLTDLNGWITPKKTFFRESFASFAQAFELVVADTSDVDDLPQERGVELAYRVYYQVASDLGYESLDSVASAVSKRLERTLRTHLEDAIDESHARIKAGTNPSPGTKTSTRTSGARDRKVVQRERAESRRLLESEVSAYYKSTSHFDVHENKDIQQAEMSAIIAEERELIEAELRTPVEKPLLQGVLQQLNEKPLSIRAIISDFNSNKSTPLDSVELERLAQVRTLIELLAKNEIDQIHDQPIYDQLRALNISRKFLFDTIVSQSSNQEAQARLEKMYNDFTEKNLRLVSAALKEVNTQDQPLGDYISVGNIALMRAVRFYDPDTGYEFSTFAMTLIKREMIKHFTRERNAMNATSRVTAEQYVKILRAQDEIRNREGRAATMEELAAATGMKQKRLDEVLARSRNFSMDENAGGLQAGEKSTSRRNLLSEGDDTRVPQGANPLFAGEDAEVWRGYIERFDNPNDKTIIIYRVGIGGEPTKTFEEIGEMVDMSQQTANNRLKKLMMALKIMHYDQTHGFEDERMLDLLAIKYGFDGLSDTNQTEWRKTFAVEHDEALRLIESAEALANDEFEDYFYSLTRE